MAALIKVICKIDFEVTYKKYRKYGLDSIRDMFYDLEDDVMDLLLFESDKWNPDLYNVSNQNMTATEIIER